MRAFLIAAGLVLGAAPAMSEKPWLLTVYKDGNPTFNGPWATKDLCESEKKLQLTNTRKLADAELKAIGTDAPEWAQVHNDSWADLIKQITSLEQSSTCRQD
jgi:hypothetical protein